MCRESIRTNMKFLLFVAAYVGLILLGVWLNSISMHPIKRVPQYQEQEKRQGEEFKHNLDRLRGN